MDSFPENFDPNSGCTEESMVFFLNPLIDNLNQPEPKLATIPHDLLNTEKKVNIINKGSEMFLRNLYVCVPVQLL